MSSVCTRCLAPFGSDPGQRRFAFHTPVGDLCLSCFRDGDGPTLAQVKQTKSAARKPKMGAH